MPGLFNWAWEQTVAASSSIICYASARFGANLLSRFVIQFRPSLDEAQRSSLQDILVRLLEAFLEGRRINVSAHIRALLAVVFHDLSEQEQDSMWREINALLQALDLGGILEEEAPIQTYEEEYDEANAAEADTLCSRHGISRERVDALPPSVRQALTEELSKQPAPVCSITLEPVLDVNARVSPDVCALVQKIERDGIDGGRRFHVFLYKRSALEQWFEIGGNVNPLTRERVHLQSQLFALS